VNGRYVLQPRIFDLLRNLEPGAGGEIQLTDAMQALMSEQEFYACQFKGRMYDCGSKAGMIEAGVAFALGRTELGELVAAPLRELLQRRA
jgi:UTP--glucose-1-phosphate uridylyltransferase